MFLSRESILKAVKNGEIGISDFKEENLKPASYSLTLGSINGKESLELKPQGFILLETKEKITLNGKYCAILSTPARLAKQGINVTQGSDFAEPDTDNTFVLETSNNGNEPIVFTQGMKIVKIAFSKIQ